MLRYLLPVNESKKLLNRGLRHHGNSSASGHVKGITQVWK